MSTATDFDISATIEQARGGDTGAFAQIVRRYQALVSGVLFSVTGDFHQAEDFCQETFLIAWRKLDELRDTDNIAAWLCTIARNLVSRSHRNKVVSTAHGSLEHELQSSEPNPDAELLRREQSEYVWSAIRGIEEKYREPLVLFYRGEQSTKQIAAALDISEETARQRLSRARKFLRKELERRVADAIASSGPGEFFSLAVLAALPVAVLSTSTGQAAAATVLATETTLAASAMVAAPKSGGGSASLFAASTGWYYVHSVIAYACSLFALLIWIVGAVPGFWFSIRNAPTLRARRFLILTSLRIHVLVGGVVLYCCLFPAARTYFYSVISGGWDYPFLQTAFNLGFYVGLCVVGAVVVFFLVDAPIVYRRILREDAGLIVPKKAVPLEESPLSYSRLQKSFFRSGIVLIVLFLAAWSSFYVWMELDRMRYASYFPYSASYTSYGNYWCYYAKYYTYFAAVGTLFLLMFRQMHRTFLSTAKDETSFAAAPPLMNKETPFFERIFIEWIVSFGVFVAAILAFLQGGLHQITNPQWPFTLLTILTITVGGSFALATVSAAVPTFRWFVNLSGFVLLFVSSTYCFTQATGSNGIELSLPDFFTTSQAWPVVFGVMLLDWIIVFGTVLALVYGGLYLRNKWRNTPRPKNRLLSRRGFAAVFCTGTVLMLLASPFFCTWPLWLYYQQVLYGMDRAETISSPTGFVEKKIEIATTCLDWMKDQPQFQTNALQSRARDYLKLGRFHESIADYDRVIALMADWPRKDRADKVFLPNYYASRAEAKLAVGDARGAIEDLDKVPRNAEFWANREYADVLYNRGFAHEKLGDTAKAIADYDETIQLLEQKPHKDLRKVCSVAIRKGFDDEKHRSTLAYQPGFRISSEELKDIRNILSQDAGVPAK